MLQHAPATETRCAGTWPTRLPEMHAIRHGAGIRLIAIIVGLTVAACTGAASTETASQPAMASPMQAPAATAPSITSVSVPTAAPAAPPPAATASVSLSKLTPAQVAAATKGAGDATLHDRTKQLAAGGGPFDYEATIMVSDHGTYAKGRELRCGTACRGNIASGEWWRVGSRSLFRADASDQSDPGSRLRYGLMGQDGWLDNELARADPAWVGVLAITDYRIAARSLRADGTAELTLRAKNKSSDPDISIGATRATVDPEGRLIGWSQTIQSTFGDRITWTRTIAYGASPIPASPLAGLSVRVPQFAHTTGVPFDWTEPIVKDVAVGAAGRALLEAPPYDEDAYGYSVRLEPRSGTARVVDLPGPAVSIRLFGQTAIVITHDGHVLEIGLGDGRIVDTGPIVAAPAFLGAEVGMVDGALVTAFIAGHVESQNGGPDYSVPDHAGLAVLRDGHWHVVATRPTSDFGTPVVLEGVCGFVEVEPGQADYRLSFAGFDCATGARYTLDLGPADSWIRPPDAHGLEVTRVPVSETQTLIALSNPSLPSTDADQMVLIAVAPHDLVALDLGTRGDVPAAIVGGSAFYRSGGGVKVFPAQEVQF